MNSVDTLEITVDRMIIVMGHVNQNYEYYKNKWLVL